MRESGSRLSRIIIQKVALLVQNPIPHRRCLRQPTSLFQVCLPGRYNQPLKTVIYVYKYIYEIRTDDDDYDYDYDDVEGLTVDIGVYVGVHTRPEPPNTERIYSYI